MSQNAQNYYIPRYLDEPMRVILWTFDELVVFLVPTLLLYLLSNELLVGFMVGAVGFLGLKRLKGSEGTGYLKALAYWHLPQIIRFKKTPPSHIRFYIG